MEKKKKRNKGVNALIIIVVIISVIAVFAGAAAAGYWIVNTASIKQEVVKPESPIKTGAVARYSLPLSGGSIPDIYNLDMNRIRSENAPTEAAVIEHLSANTDACINELRQEEGDGGSIYYSLKGAIFRIDVPQGANGFNYKRSYYFNNGILYFARMSSGRYENRLYFNNNSLFRYTGEDGGTVDNAFGNEYYDAVGKFAYNEAYAFYDYKMGVSTVR